MRRQGAIRVEIGRNGTLLQRRIPQYAGLIKAVSQFREALSEPRRAKVRAVCRCISSSPSCLDAAVLSQEGHIYPEPVSVLQPSCYCTLHGESVIVYERTFRPVAARLGPRRRPPRFSPCPSCLRTSLPARPPPQRTLSLLRRTVRSHERSAATSRVCPGRAPRPFVPSLLSRSLSLSTAWSLALSHT